MNNPVDSFVYKQKMYKVFKNGLQSYIINIISLSIIHVFVIFGIYRCDKNAYVQTLDQVFFLSNKLFLIFASTKNSKPFIFFRISYTM